MVENENGEYFLISAFLGGGKFICVHWFEILGEYSAAACTRSYSLGSKKSAEYHHYMIGPQTKNKKYYFLSFVGILVVILGRFFRAE